LTPAQPSIFSSILGGALTGAGLFGGLRKGGKVPSSGLKLVRKPHSDAREDRAQVLDILRERNLIKNRGGLAAARRAA
jgi:hypothetical protein